MAEPGCMSDMGVVEPNKSLLAKQLNPVLVPDMENSQATGQGATLHEYKPNTHTIYYQLLHLNQHLISLSHLSKGAARLRMYI